MGKDHSDPINYRSIAITSCVCKIMEWMINERLIWFLETNNIITNKNSVASGKLEAQSTSW
jgi:potassium voltage-gated channel Eag-related subfamily H protein 8